MVDLPSAAGLRLGCTPDGVPQLVDIASGKIVRFEAMQVPGRGWSVARIVGSRRTGRSIERAPEFAGVDGYTMQQAQTAAQNHMRAVVGFLSPEYQKRLELQRLREDVARVLRR